MATRAIIKVQGYKTAQLYKHFDGYPEGTLPWLEAFNKDFTDNRGDDPDYKFAQLIRSSIRDAEEFGLGTCKYTGWGVVPLSEDMGAVYEYCLMGDGSVNVKKLWE